MSDEIPTTPHSSTPLLSGFETLGKVASVLGSILLFLSVFYDWSFLTALGLRFSEVPTTIADHVRSAIVWVPQVGGAIIVVLIYEMAMTRIEGGRTEEELLAASPYPRFTRALRASADKAWAIVGFGGAALWLLVGASYGALYILFLPTWGALVRFIVTHPRIGKRFNFTTSLIFTIAPMMLAIVGWFGYASADRMLTATAPSWEVTIADGEKRTVQPATGVRRFESVMVVIDMQKNVTL